MRVLILCPYPFDSAGSQRFRFEQYFSAFNNHQIHYHQKSFWSNKAWKILYQKGWKAQSLKMYYLIIGIIKRFFLLNTLKRYDYIFVHREIFPTGPSILISWLVKKNPKVIYDFDDAIWLPNYAASNKRFAFLKNYTQVEQLCTKAYKISVGNHYLANYAQQFNANTVIIPTTIDTQNWHTGSIDYTTKTLVFGWTGTHSTMKYLPELLPILDELQQRYSFKLLIISDKHPDFEREYVQYLPWSKASEIKDLKQMHIGLMPLHDDQWSRGKCGFKALQYMSMGMPAIVSPVGVNAEIVDHGINGFVALNDDEWKNALEHFLLHPTALKNMGVNAKAKIESHYSVNALTPKFLSLFTCNSQFD